MESAQVLCSQSGRSYASYDSGNWRKMKYGKLNHQRSLPSKQTKDLISADVDKRLDTLFAASKERCPAQQAAIFSDFRKELLNQENLL